MSSKADNSPVPDAPTDRAAHHLRVSSVFDAALDLPKGRRERFLDLACADEPAVRQEVGELLVFAEDAQFLESAAHLAAGESTRLQTPAGPGGASPPGTPPPAPHVSDPFIGRKVHEYVILRKLGEGGMGVVYLALDTKLERQVALKVIRREYASNADYRKRLVSEAQFAAQLSHQNIAAVFTRIEEDDEIFIVSEFVDGESLREMMDRGLIPYRPLLDLFIGVARGLAAAHARGIVHRDVKPDNILLTGDGEPKIVDFGLAKSHKALLKTTRVTKSGTPAYMAPEQAVDHPARPIDFRADIFAFGVTLYEAITGHNPFEGRSLFTTLDNIIHRDPPDPTRSNVELGDLGRIVRRCLQKKPEDRYSSTKDLVGDLERLRGTDLDGRKSNRIWWEVHQLGTTAFYAAILVFLWWVHPLARPEAASRALALLGVLVGSALGLVRLHFWFASRQGLVKLAESIRRFGPWVARGDAVLSAILFGMSGLFLYTDRPNTAVIFVILAVVNLGLTFIIEPAAKADAFPEDDDKRNSPPQGPPSAPAA